MNDIPEYVLRRYPIYLQIVRERGDKAVGEDDLGRNAGEITSGEIALASGIGDTTVRRDLARLAPQGRHLGRTNSGYGVRELLERLEAAVPGAATDHSVLLAGDGPLAEAFVDGETLLPATSRWRVVAIVDTRFRRDNEREGIRLVPLKSLDAFAADTAIDLAVITRPPAGRYVHALSSAGIRSIVSCLPEDAIHEVPEGVVVKRFAVEEMFLRTVSNTAVEGT